MEKLIINEVRILNLMQINTLPWNVHACAHDRGDVRASFHVRAVCHVRACGLRTPLQAPPQASSLLLILHSPLSSPQPSCCGGVFPSSHPSFQAQHEAQQRAWHGVQQQAQHGAQQRVFPRAWQLAFLPLQAFRELKRGLAQQREQWQVQVHQQQLAQQQLVLGLLQALRCEDERHRRTEQREDRQESIEPSSINYKQHHHQHVQIRVFETTQLSIQNRPKSNVQTSTHTFRLSLLPFITFFLSKEE